MEPSVVMLRTVEPSRPTFLNISSVFQEYVRLDYLEIIASRIFIT